MREQLERRAFTISFEESALFTEVYGFVGRSGRIFLEGQLLLPGNAPSDTVLLFMHPSSALNLLPLPRAFAEAGLHVMCCGSRYIRNDTSLIMEKAIIDMGAYVRYAKEVLGYGKVVLVGWSGGGSLSIAYQAEAEQPTITETPAGDPIDLAAAGLIPADAIWSVAAHLSRAETLTEWLDPSVVHEGDPDHRDRALDIYTSEALAAMPFDPAFVARFRASQVERNRRITSWADAMLRDLRARGTDEMERGFIVHRTMCDPRWIDPSVDPNGRKPNWCYLGNPRTANAGPVGLARYTTLRSWLSQWSYDRSNARTSLNAPRITVPALVIENGADDATPATHPRKIFELLGSADKSFEKIDDATHYFQQQPALQERAVAICKNWLRERCMIKA
ncbi:alpha/beta hydrolase (plasmid) [Sphingobium sp. LB126]|nr:alpha/beta hydrolase [Sphingobium sp. LB126]